MSKTTKLTATFNGVTATRRTPRAYTHVVFGLRSGERDAQATEAQLAAHRRERELTAEALDFLRRGETPPAGHALLQVTSRNYYHAFTRWDDIALDSNDGGRTFRLLSVAEAEAQIASYSGNDADYVRRLTEQAAEQRASGEQWVACSWHHSLALAVKGAEVAMGYGHIVRTEIVPVDR